MLLVLASMIWICVLLRSISRHGMRVGLCICVYVHTSIHTCTNTDLLT